jgi:hypothetical protein
MLDMMSIIVQPGKVQQHATQDHPPRCSYSLGCLEKNEYQDVIAFVLSLAKECFATILDLLAVVDDAKLQV